MRGDSGSTFECDLAFGKGSSDKYLEEWRRVSRPCGDDIEEVMQAEAARLEAHFSDERLEAMVKAGGIDPGSGD